MAANYNNSAWFYDGLARLVYGKALVKAQVYLLQFVPPNSKVLIVGGGTGWILEELTNIHPSGLTITYVEIARNMMALSKKRYTGQNEIIFINEVIEDADVTGGMDVAITPFLFDNFSEENLEKVFTSVKALLKNDALWLNCSFQSTGKWWQFILLKSMYIFFRLTCAIEASKLPNIEQCFANGRYTAVEEKTFFGDFIISRVYNTETQFLTRMN